MINRYIPKEIFKSILQRKNDQLEHIRSLIDEKIHFKKILNVQYREIY